MNKAFRRVLPLLVIGVIMLTVSGVMLYRAFHTDPAAPTPAAPTAPAAPAETPEPTADEAQLLREQAAALWAEGRYDEAYDLWEKSGDHETVLRDLRERAEERLAAGQFDEAYALWRQAGETGRIEENILDRAREMLARDTEEDCRAVVELLAGLNSAEGALLLARAEDRLEQLRPGPLSAGAQAGDRVLFGRFEQDGDEDNGPEPIEWIVLDRQENKAVLISRYALWYDGAETGDRAATGAAWLGMVFTPGAFSEEERSCLLAEGSYIGRDNMRAWLPTGAISLAAEDVRICLPTEAARLAAGEETAGPVAYLGANRVSVYTENFTVFRIDETGATMYSVIQRDPAYVRPMIAPDLSRLPG